MIRPSCEMIEELAKTYNTIPICKEIYADVITPITLLRKLAQISSQYYLLESIEGGEKWSRYSFLGFDPILHATCKDNTVTIEGKNHSMYYGNCCQTTKHQGSVTCLPLQAGSWVILLIR